MALLHRHRDVGFAPARDALGLTDGNLASHAARLEAAGFLRARRVLEREGFVLRYRITEAGAAAFRAYADWLRELVREAEASGPEGP
jgi:DNA-binding MarR family transcriptional regulator